MAEIRFRKNNTNYHLDYRGIGAPCEQRLAFRYSGNTYYVPAMSTQGTKVFGGTFSGESWYYDTSSPTIAFRKNGRTYYCSKSLTTESYDIPAGTYSPFTFERLITSFIAQNGSRTVKNNFSVTVNGQTYSVSAGHGVFYTYQYSGSARFVCFNGNPRGWISFEQPGSFAQYGIYCTYWSYSSIQGDQYSRYNITVNTGFNFK